MVPRPRFERGTYGLGGRRSIQLSYRGLRNARLACRPGAFFRYGGAEEDRTPDLRIANATLSQLSYGPFSRAFSILRSMLQRRGLRL